jgi:hypothetical protein
LLGVALVLLRWVLHLGLSMVLIDLSDPVMLGGGSFVPIGVAF